MTRGHRRSILRPAIMNRWQWTTVLTILYLLQSTWIIYAGADLLGPPSLQSLGGPADPCGRCGCPEEIQKRRDCCCGPQADALPATASPSTMEAARCRGADAAVFQVLSQPIVCDFGRFESGPEWGCEFHCPDVVPRIDDPVCPPDKVPIG